MSTQEQTAREIWNYLTSRGWTKESVAAVLGNMQSESGIIADRWESDKVGNMSGGYGLVQWTPATKYIDWAKARGLVYQAVSSQCERLIWEVANNQQFAHPTMSFKQFTQSMQSPEVLADIFIRYYERPLNPNQPVRQTQARYWYNKFKGTTSEKERIVTMFKLFRIDGAPTVYFYNGITVVPIANEDQLKIIQVIYKENNGKDLNVEVYSRTRPWYARIKEVAELKPVTNWLV